MQNLLNIEPRFLSTAVLMRTNLLRWSTFGEQKILQKFTNDRNFVLTDKIPHCRRVTHRSYLKSCVFMGQSVSRERSVTPRGTGPTFITHLHSFQCRGGHVHRRPPVRFVFRGWFLRFIRRPYITAISTTLGI